MEARKCRNSVLELDIHRIEIAVTVQIGDQSMNKNRTVDGDMSTREKKTQARLQQRARRRCKESYPMAWRLGTILSGTSEALSPSVRWAQSRIQCCKHLLTCTGTLTAMRVKTVDYCIASEETLIQLCHNSSSPILNNPDFRRKVVKIPDHAFIKYGPGFTQWEDATQ